MQPIKPAGYSGTPLAKKLGFKAQDAVWVIAAPYHYFDLFDHLPEGIRFHHEPQQETYAVIHFFTQSKEELRRHWEELKSRLEKGGSLWISWPKGTSKLQKDLNENDVRELALAGGLVDVKVCAVDMDWSGLKLMYRTKDR